MLNLAPEMPQQYIRSRGWTWVLDYYRNYSVCIITLPFATLKEFGRSSLQQRITLSRSSVLGISDNVFISSANQFSIFKTPIINPLYSASFPPSRKNEAPASQKTTNPHVTPNSLKSLNTNKPLPPSPTHSYFPQPTPKHSQGTHFPYPLPHPKHKNHQQTLHQCHSTLTRTTIAPRTQDLSPRHHMS